MTTQTFFFCFLASPPAAEIYRQMETPDAYITLPQEDWQLRKLPWSLAIHCSQKPVSACQVTPSLSSVVIIPSAPLQCQEIWEKHNSAHRPVQHNLLEDTAWLQMFSPPRAHFDIHKSALDQNWGRCMKVCWLASPRRSSVATCQVHRGWSHSIISLFPNRGTWTCYRTDDCLVIQCDPICQIKIQWKQQLVATPKISFESLSL